MNHTIDCEVCGADLRVEGHHHDCGNPTATRRVILESPYGAKTEELIERNVRYARACVRDSLLRFEAPIASHLLYTQPGVLKDEIPAERNMGISAGLAWLCVANATVVYTDLGISPGMEHGIKLAKAVGVPVEKRSLGRGWK